VDFEKAPQVEVDIEPFNTIIEVALGIGTAPPEHIHVLLVEGAAARIDPLHIHRAVLAPHPLLHTERLHLLQTALAIVKPTDNEHDYIFLGHSCALKLLRLYLVYLWLRSVAINGRRCQLSHEIGTNPKELSR